jgi:hypothetical protein
MPKSTVTDHEILEAALIGLQHSLATVHEKIKEVRRRLGGKPARNEVPAASAGDGRPRRVMGTAARRRIAAAQRKRWAAYRKAQ